MAATKRAAKTPNSIHQLKVTLLGMRPPIWRRIQVPSDVTLARLHDILQMTMGWHDSHLHQFRVGETTYGDPGILENLDVRNERTARLNQVAPGEKHKLYYEYDFGDGWEHEILVEKVLPPEPGVRYPLCLIGKRACPPEDCGGIWGYADLLEIIRDPEHDEHESMMEWLGGDFDPEAFDVEVINQRLAYVR
jgi:hypothetical protein